MVDLNDLNLPAAENPDIPMQEPGLGKRQSKYDETVKICVDDIVG